MESAEWAVDNSVQTYPWFTSASTGAKASARGCSIRPAPPCVRFSRNSRFSRMRFSPYWQFLNRRRPKVKATSLRVPSTFFCSEWGARASLSSRLGPHGRVAFAACGARWYEGTVREPPLRHKIEVKNEAQRLTLLD